MDKMDSWMDNSGTHAALLSSLSTI